MASRHCSKCGKAGHQYLTCGALRVTCSTCGRLGHRSVDCAADTLLYRPMRRCPPCWTVAFVDERHVCGERRRMTIPWRVEEYV